MGRRQRGRVVVIGLGNIGSHVAILVARLGRIVQEITLIDRDSYDETNLRSQDIGPRDLGKPKATVLARRLRRLNLGCRVRAVHEPVEAVARGTLRADVILAAVDSRAARQVINEVAWRLGVPWIDAGVEASHRLARVSVFVPGDTAPCAECGWSDADYAAAEQELPCGSETAPATGAPALLGALAAAVQAAECEKVLTGGGDSLAGREFVLGTKRHMHQVTALRRNDRCRFDHASWNIERLTETPGRLAVQQLFDLVTGNGAPARLRVEGLRFVVAHVCPGCQESQRQLGLSGRAAVPVCPNCSEPMVASGFHTYDRIDAAVCEELPRWSLRRLGFRPGDVFTLSIGERERHFEIGGHTG